MADRIVADRYAQALVGMISDMKELDRIDAEINSIADLLETDEKFRRYFLSPRVKPVDKKALIRKAIEGRVSQDVLHLILLIIDKHREKIATTVARRFSQLADEIRGVETGTVITAVPLPDEEFKMLEHQIRKFSRRRITLHREIDPTLIGGMVLWLGDHVIDGSIRHRLELIRRNLMEIKTHLMSEGNPAD